jgi:hypothetical protein
MHKTAFSGAQPGEFWQMDRGGSLTTATFPSPCPGAGPGGSVLRAPLSVHQLLDFHHLQPWNESASPAPPLPVPQVNTGGDGRPV